MDGRREEPKNNPAEEEGGPEMWEALNRNFKQVQSVLDKNRALIQQVNENHRSKIADNMFKNVALIREINVNISKVASLYSDLSSDFSSMFHQRNENTPDDKKEEEGSSNNSVTGASRIKIEEWKDTYLFKIIRKQTRTPLLNQPAGRG